MAWIYYRAFHYSAGAADSTKDCQNGSSPSLTVKRTEELNPCSCPEWDGENFPLPRFGMTCERCEGLRCLDWRQLWEDSPARISRLLELEQAWMAAEAGLCLNFLGSLASADLDSFSWKTSQLSLFGGLTDFSWNSMRWGMMRGGQLFQPRKWEPSTFENDGSYLPTPTACDYGKNVGRKSDGITPRGRDRYSLAVLARRGELLGHPKGLLNPEWVEQAMGWKIGATAIESWVMESYQSALKRRLKS